MKMNIFGIILAVIWPTIKREVGSVMCFSVVATSPYPSFGKEERNPSPAPPRGRERAACDHFYYALCIINYALNLW